MHQPQERVHSVKDTLNLHGHTHDQQIRGPYVNACVEIVGYRPRVLRDWVLESGPQG